MARGGDTRFKPGRKQGRPPGRQNKITEDMKAVFLEAFQRLGGVPSLVKWGRTNRTEFYKILARMIPLQVNATLRKEHADMTDAELEARYLELEERETTGPRRIEGTAVSAKKPH